MTEAQQRPTVITCKVRLSFPRLFETYTNAKGKKLYDAVFILPKADKIADPKYAAEAAATLDQLYKAMQHHAAQAYGANIPPGLVNPIKDGDGKRPSDGQPYGKEVHGCFMFGAQTGEKFPPVVVLNETDSLNNGNWKRAEVKDVYAGCYVRVAVSPFDWDDKGRKGISFNLITVQKLEDGEPFGYSPRPENFFGSPAAAAGVQHSGQTSPGALFGVPGSPTPAPAAMQQGTAAPVGAGLFAR